MKKLTIGDLIANPALIRLMPLGEVLEAIGLDIEVEDIEHPENNARLTELMKSAVDKKHQQ